MALMVLNVALSTPSQLHVRKENGQSSRVRTFLSGSRRVVKYIEVDVIFWFLNLHFLFLVLS